MDIQAILQNYQMLTERKLAEKIQLLGEKCVLRDACEYALVNGGKRLRPAFVMMIAQALGSFVDVTDVALGVEFFHTASLIADDLPCMDNDDMRRGKPSLHKKYDEATALLASYALIGAGYRTLYENMCVLKSSKAPYAARAEEICSLALENASHNTGILGATGGQFLDIYPPDQELATIQEVVSKKTGTLFEVAFVFGWLFGGGDKEKLELVKQAAYHFGMAFQMQDDLDDVKQDIEHERSINFAARLGIRETLEMLSVEIQEFEKIVEILDIQSNDFSALTEFLKERERYFRECYHAEG